MEDLPNEVPVMCNGNQGLLLKRTAAVLCSCAECQGKVEWTPFAWQAHSGLHSNKNWKSSIRALLSSGEETSVGKYLRTFGADIVRQGTAARLVVVPLQAARGARGKQAEPRDGSEAPADRVARTAERLRGAVSPLDILPAEFAVVCNDVEGTFETAAWTIRCGCPECGGKTAFSPSSWEAHVGSRQKRWHSSILIVPGGAVSGVPAGTQPLPLGRYIRMFNLQVAKATTRAPGHPPALIPIDKDEE